MIEKSIHTSILLHGHLDFRLISEYVSSDVVRHMIKDGETNRDTYRVTLDIQRISKDNGLAERKRLLFCHSSLRTPEYYFSVVCLGLSVELTLSVGGRSVGRQIREDTLYSDALGKQGANRRAESSTRAVHLNT